LDTYRVEEAEFAPNGQLNREIKDRKFTQTDLRYFRGKHSTKGWLDSVEGISKWLDYHQSILEYSQQGLKTSTTFPKDQLRALEQRNFSYSMATADVHMVFKTVVKCIGNKSAGNQVKSDNYIFPDHEHDVRSNSPHAKEWQETGKRVGEECRLQMQRQDDLQVTRKLDVVQ
jgi:hypothetical protein